MSFSRLFRRLAKSHQTFPPRRNKVVLESLKPRLLLSSDPLSYMAPARAAIDRTLRLDDGTQEAQLIDNKGANPDT